MPAVLKRLIKTFPNAKPTWILARHFFKRFFRNDFFYFEDLMKEKLIASLAVLSAIIGLFAKILVGKYLITPDTSSAWMEKTVFLYFLMVIMGFAAVMEWDVLFPDASDRANLLPLPIKTGSIFAGKFLSLSAFGGIMALGFNLIASLVFAFYLSQWQAKNLLDFFLLIGVHLFVCMAACLCIFFLSILGIGLLMTLCGPKLFRKVSVFLRSALLIAFILQMIFLASAPGPFVKSISAMDLTTSPPPLFCRLFPPMWFAGLYETLIGNQSPAFGFLARIAAISMIAIPAAFLLILWLSYRRNLSDSSAAPFSGISAPAVSRAARFFDRIQSLFLKNPTEKAVFHFIRFGLKRSLMHKMQMLTYTAVCIGLVGIILAYQIGKDLSLTRITKSLLAIPLLTILILLLGAKHTFSLPISLKAGWIFRFTEHRDKNAYLKGTKKILGIGIYGPLILILFPAMVFLWGLLPALIHAFYSLMIALVLVELLFWNYSKIPFAYSPLPGKSKLQFFFPIYFILILIYGKFLSATAKQLIENPVMIPIIFAIGSGLLIALHKIKSLIFKPAPTLCFEELPEPVVLTLDSED